MSDDTERSTRHHGVLRRARARLIDHVLHACAGALRAEEKSIGPGTRRAFAASRSRRYQAHGAACHRLRACRCSPAAIKRLCQCDGHSRFCCLVLRLQRQHEGGVYRSPKVLSSVPLSVAQRTMSRLSVVNPVAPDPMRKSRTLSISPSRQFASLRNLFAMEAQPTGSI